MITFTEFWILCPVKVELCEDTSDNDKHISSVTMPYGNDAYEAYLTNEARGFETKEDALKFLEKK